MNLKKILRRLVVMCLCVVTLGSCLQVSAKEVTLDVEYVTITKFGFVADTLNGVESKYNPWGTNYDCGELVRRYYKEVYGLTVSLAWDKPNVTSTDEYWFEVVDEPQTGDVLFASAWARGKSYGHWALCKETDKQADTITMFEQNWRWNGMAGVGRQISYSNNCYTYYRLMNTNGRVLFIEEGLGKYDSIRSITLSQVTAGKYVNTDGQEVSASGYGISAPIELNMGDILLVPSASAVPAAVSLFARQVVRTYAKVIGYTYTYQAENPELYETATADYDHSLVYYAVYDTSGETPTLTGWTRGGQTYTTLPATREVTESYYEPLMKQAVAAMPSTGYYVYLCPTTMTIVVSGYTATVNGGVAKAVGLGIFKNIATNFIGAPGQSVLAQAFADVFGLIDGLRANAKHLGECQATCIDSEFLPKVCGEPLVIEAAGAPSIAPLFVGQRYHDTTNKKVYEAFAVTNSTNDWVLLN